MDRDTLLRRFGRRLRLGLVGGGADSVIGRTHLMAMRVDGYYDLVAGAMSIDSAIARTSAEDLFLAPDRTYLDYGEMAAAEAARADGIDVVAIATPPQTHAAITKAFLARGIDVLCEKPLTRDLSEACDLSAAAVASEALFCLTHCYSGYPLVREARAMIAAGRIGKVRLIETELSAGDPGVLCEPDDPAQRHWRFRASSMGKAGLLGEVGSHAFHLGEYVSGCKAQAVSATMTTFARGREVYDNAYLTLRYGDGVQGRLWASYAAAGRDHGLWFRVFGDEGHLAWHQEEPEFLLWKPLGAAETRIGRGQDGLSETSLAATRLRPGHPEGYILAFATLYSDFAAAVMARRLGENPRAFLAELSGVEDGLGVMAMIAAAETSHDAEGAWTWLERN